MPTSLRQVRKLSWTPVFAMFSHPAPPGKCARCSNSRSVAVMWWRAEWLAPGGRLVDGLAAALQEDVREYFADASEPQHQHQGFREAYRCPLPASVDVSRFGDLGGMIWFDRQVGRRHQPLAP